MKQWVIADAVFSLFIITVSIIHFPSESISQRDFWLFTLSSLLFITFYSLMAYNAVKKDLISDMSPLVVIWATLLFRNIPYILLIVFLSTLISFYFGIRRPHAVIFNATTRINSSLIILWLSHFLSDLMSPNMFALFLWVFVLNAIFFTLETIQLIIIISFSQSISALQFLKNYFDKVNLIFLFLSGSITLTIFLLLPDSYLLVMTLFVLSSIFEIQRNIEQLKLQSTQDQLKENEDYLFTQKIKLEKLESLRMLTGGIAHDFNNILTIIMGNLEMLNIKDPDEDQLESLEGIRYGMRQATNLVSQLLVFSKMGKLNLEDKSINQIIVETSEFILQGSKSKCNFNFEGENYCKIDASKFSQIIGNLILNASQSMVDGGIIDIQVESIDLSEPDIPLEPGNYVLVKIKDEGRGIPSEFHHQIFDPYFTLREDGHGLGLATTFSLVHAHNGYITFESEENKGCTFYLYLPSGEKPVDIEEKTEIKSHQHYTGRILLMDDNYHILGTLGRLLLSFGDFTIQTALDGENCLRKFHEAISLDERFDVIIMDLTIPGGLGGEEIIQEIRDTDRNVKCVVSSGYSKKNVMENYKEYGFDAALEKPYTLDNIKSIFNLIYK